MRKVLVCLLATSSVSVFATDNSAFQAFDDQYNLGYGMSQTTVTGAAGTPNAEVTNQFINLDVERLFDAGVWMDVQANMVTNSTTNQSQGVGSGASAISGGQTPLNQGFNLGGLNAKVGYAFTLADQHLQITPYALGGRNTNLSYSTMIANGQQNLTNDYFWTAGIGGRIEYRINGAILVYADQNGVYNWDQSGPNNGIEPQNNIAYTSTLGAKFNIVKNLQLGVNGFYTGYSSQATIPTLTTGVGSSSQVYYPQSTFGGLVTVGLTY